VPGFSSFAIAASAIDALPAEEPAPETLAEPTVEETPTPEPVAESVPLPIAEQPAPIIATTGPRKSRWLMPAISTLVVLLILAGVGVLGMRQHRASLRHQEEHERQLAHEREEIAQHRQEIPDVIAHHDAVKSGTQTIASLGHADHPAFRHPEYHTHIAPLREYIRSARSCGVPEADISRKLADAGWNAQVIAHELGPQK
jgi:hypothetical protein